MKELFVSAGQSRCKGRHLLSAALFIAVSSAIGANFNWERGEGVRYLPISTKVLAAVNYASLSSSDCLFSVNVHRMDWDSCILG